MDSRIGSRHYWEQLGPSAQLVTLEYADICFEGNGPNGTVQVGIEIKKLNDALACLVDGRFSGHQLPGLVQQYDRAYFLIEGLWRGDKDGILQIGRGHLDGDKFGGWWSDANSGRTRYTYRQFTGWLESISQMANIKVIRTVNELETVQMILSLASWWAKDWTEHHSLHAFNESRPDAALLYKPPLRRRIAAELPSIGWTRSKAVADRFPTTRDMVNASVDQWSEIDGIGIGIASKVHDALRSE